MAQFSQPLELAAASLGVGTTIFKKLCRKLGIPRWPKRVRSSILDLQELLEVGLCECQGLVVSYL
jgi:hypothetical protein